jgi:hypothetical protein
METNPAAEVSQASVEDRLAAAFEKAGMRDDPQSEEEVTDDQPEASPDDTDDTEEESPEAEASPEETTEDAEEVEYEGKSYKLPKELKDALLRQQDYTKKTQEVAATRRSVEERAQALQAEVEFNAAHFNKALEAHALNAQLQQFAQVNWAELAEADSARYLMLDRQQRTLQDAANRVNAELQQLGGEFLQKKQEARQKAQAKCIEELRRDYKDFGPELLRSLDETGRKFGFSAEELSQVTDPRMIRVLHAATQYQKLQGKSIADKKVQGVKPVQVKSARSAQGSQANAQMAELKSRLQKTGKSSDAEALLAARFAKSMR